MTHAARAASLAICRDGFLLLGGLRGCWLRDLGIRLGGPAALGSRTVPGYPIAMGVLEGLNSCCPHRALGEVATRNFGVDANRIEEVRMIVSVAAHPVKAAE